MRGTAAAAAILLVLATGSEARAQQATEVVVPDSVTPARVLEGSALFNDGTCTVCHAVGGRGTGRRAPNLSDAEWLHSTGDLAGIIHTIFWGVQRSEFKAVTPRRFEMHPTGGMHLDPAQLLAIAAYVWTLSRPGTSEFVAQQQHFLDLARLGRMDDAIALFRQARTAFPDHLLLAEAGLNAFGYEFLNQRHDPANAITLFRLNVELHPDAWNVYDSLGEGLAAAGNVPEAIRNYETSLRLNPDNDNARKALEKLRNHRQ